MTDRRVTLYRDTAGRAHVTGLRRPRTDAAPAGYEWGYGGAGSATLARDLLRAAGATAREADRWHQPFKWALIAKLPLHGARLNLDAMRRTVNELGGRRLGTEECVKELVAAAAPERLTEAHYRHRTPSRSSGPHSPGRITTRAHQPAGAAPIDKASHRRGVRSIAEEARSISRAGRRTVRSTTEGVRSISRFGWRTVRSITEEVRSIAEEVRSIPDRPRVVR